jgi:hypothetical protein
LTPRRANIETIPAQPEATPIEQMTGHASQEEMLASLPTSTVGVTGQEKQRGPNGRLLKADGTERAPKGSGTRRTTQPAVNPLMQDERYRRAIQGINFFGAPRMINSGFGIAATLMNDPEMSLKETEKEAVDDYFYALSKHLSFDPMANVVGRLLVLLALIGELVVKRMMKYTDIGKWLKTAAAQVKQQHETKTEVEVS